MVEIRSEIERLWAVKSLRQSRSAWCILRQRALWVVSGNDDGAELRSRGTTYREEFVGVKNRCDAESASQIRIKNLGVFCCTAQWRGMVAVYRFLSSAY